MLSGHVISAHPLVGLTHRLIDGGVIFLVLWICTSVTDVVWVPAYTIAILIAITIFILAGGAVELYDRSWRSVSSVTESRRMVQAWIWVVIGLLILAYITKTTTIYSRLAITSWFMIAPVVLVMWRVLGRYLVSRLATNRPVRKVGIAGAGRLGKQLAGTILSHPDSGMNISAFYDDFCEPGIVPLGNNSAKVEGNLDQMITDSRSGKFDEIYIALPMRAEGRIREITDKLANTSMPVFLVPDLFAFTLMHAKMSDLAGMPLINVYGSPHYGTGGVVKRIEDIVLGLFILVLIAIPMVIIGLFIKIGSSGPVLFKQRRYGMGGEEVVVWKFRTMDVMEDDGKVVQATKDDPRVTRIGRILRRTSLDELPQFFNVLQGRMSIVGPRPHAVVHNEEYRDLIKGYMLRHLVKPGITGWAQVNGWRGETDSIEKMEKRIEYDLEYIRNWSLWFDLKIIILTVVRGLYSKKAY